MMPKVTFVHDGDKKEVEAATGATLRNVALDHGVPIHHDPIFIKLTWTWPLAVLDIFGVPVSPNVANFPNRLLERWQLGAWRSKAAPVWLLGPHCKGLGLCGTCHVKIAKGKENCSPVGTWEKIRLSVASFNIGCEDEMRLACQTQVNGDVEVVTRPELNLTGEAFWA